MIVLLVLDSFISESKRDGSQAEILFGFCLEDTMFWIYVFGDETVILDQNRTRCSRFRSDQNQVLPIMPHVLPISPALQLVCWREPRKSLAAFVSSLTVLVAMATLSVISVVSYLLLACLCVTITFRWVEFS